MKKRLLTNCLVWFMLTANALMAQHPWWKSEPQTARVSKSAQNSKNLKEKKEDNLFTFSFDTDQFTALLKNENTLSSKSSSARRSTITRNNNLVIDFPNEDGSPEQYEIIKQEVLPPVLASKYPNLLSFIGKSKKNPSKTIRFTFHPSVGLQGTITSGTSEKFLINKNTDTTSSIRKQDAEEELGFDCTTGYNFINNVNLDTDLPTRAIEEVLNDGYLRRFRIAIAASATYSNFFLDGSEKNQSQKKTKVLTSIVSSLHRINSIFERDFSITLQLVENNDDIIFLDQNSDPFTGLSDNTLNTKVQNTIDTVIGNANYDLGQLFNYSENIRGNSGSIGNVCKDGLKGSAYTSHSDPASDTFNLIVAHEMGHQFGTYHIMSSWNCRSGSGLTEVEPGAGSTIMGYPGTQCAEAPTNAPDDYFNYVNIRDVSQYLQTTSCATLINTGNTAPHADAGDDRTIPASTPFILEGNAVDVEGDALTYCWEQNNSEDTDLVWGDFEYEELANNSNLEVGAIFRSRPPVASNKRYMPALEDLVNGIETTVWEILPAFSRSIRFQMTVRDNNPVGGQVGSDYVNIHVDNSAGPFLVKSQNEYTSWEKGTYFKVSWAVANTDQSPINEKNVDILLSVDGGITYPYTIAKNVPNDGYEKCVLPANLPTTQKARVMVKASNNIFFNISDSNFEIKDSQNFLVATDNDTVSVCKSEDLTFNLTYSTYGSFNETVTFSSLNKPAGVGVSFSPSQINGGSKNNTSIKASVSGIDNLESGSYEFLVKGETESGLTKYLKLYFNVREKNVASVRLLSPENNTQGFSTHRSQFTWSNENAESYQIQIATDSSFNNIVDQSTTNDSYYNSYILDYNKTYYWRVRAINNCKTGNFSVVNKLVTQCQDPIDFHVTAQGPSYVYVSWADENTSEWEIQYGTAGFNLGTGNIRLTSTMTTLVTSLSPETTYDFYVRSSCANDGVGTWVGPLTLTTTKDYCSGENFYDTGGKDGDYGSNELITTVISPSLPNQKVRVNFKAFNLERSYDYLTVYDGPNANYPRINIDYTGTTIPEELIATNIYGALTFVFESDSFGVRAGWEAEVTCELNDTIPEEYVSIPALIEAENYSTELNTGIEDTADPDGGNQNVGWIHTNDYVTYDINVPASGEYMINFRVASKSKPIKFDIYQNENNIGTIEEAPTGHHQTWTTIATNVDLTEGNQTIKLVATGGGWNINWLEFVESDIKTTDYVSIPALIEAEDYSTELNTDIEDTKDPEGGDQNVGWIDTNDYVTYDINVPASGEYTINFRVASKSKPIKFDIYQNEKNVGTIEKAPTGHHQAWTTTTTNVNLTKGNQTIKLLATGGGWNINWLEFVKNESIEEVSCILGTNLALNGSVVDFSSEQNDTNNVTNVIDGNTSNRWSAAGFPQYVVVDLGESYNVNKINLETYGNRDYTFTVEGSSSSASSGYTALVNGSGSTTSSFSTEKVRYVKLTITGATEYRGTWVSIHDFEIICAGSSNKDSLIPGDSDTLELTVSPNPTMNYIQVHSNAQDLSIANYSIIDITGTIVKAGRLDNTRISVSEVASGIYILKVNDNKKLAVTRFVKE